MARHDFWWAHRVLQPGGRVAAASNMVDVVVCWRSRNDPSRSQQHASALRNVLQPQGGRSRLILHSPPARPRSPGRNRLRTFCPFPVKLGALHFPFNPPNMICHMTITNDKEPPCRLTFDPAADPDNMARTCALSTCRFDQLPDELLAHVAAQLPLQDRLPLATVSKRWLAAVRAAGAAGVALELGARSRDVPSELLAASPVNTLALVTPGACAASHAAAAASQASRWDPQEQQLWQQAAGRGRARPSTAAWHLRRALASAAGAGAGRRHPLTLLLAAPEWDTSAAEVQRMLQAAGAEQLVGRVAVPLGLLRLDGSLAAVLVRCNARAASLPSGLQVSLLCPTPPLLVTPCGVAVAARRRQT